MQKKQINIFFFLIVFFLSTMFFRVVPIYSQFITPEDEEVTIDQEDPVKKAPSKSEVQDTDIVQNLFVSIAGDLKNNVKITWTPGKKQDDYIIARSSNPIYNNTLLKAAKSIAVVPPTEREYIDRALPAGTYYYAIASREAIRNNKVHLIARFNYTTTPIIIKSIPKSQEEKYPLPPTVSLIHAEVVNNQYVKITWKGVTSANITYVVYRSPKSFDDSHAFDYARKIAEIDDTAMYSKANYLFHIDKVLPKAGNYYYAVVCRNSFGRENRYVVPDQSYTKFPVNYQGQSNIITVKGIRSKIRNNNNVVLQWRSWNIPKDYILTIYRSNRPIKNEQQIASAKKIAKLMANRESYVDENVDIGSYFYAIVIEDKQKRIVSNVTLGENSTIYAANITHRLARNDINPSSHNQDCASCKSNKNQSYFFFDLNAIVRNNMIFLYWKSSEYAKYMGKNYKIYLYRFTRKPRDLSYLRDSVLVAKLPLEKTFYEDVPPNSGMYFYALFIETPKGLLPHKFEIEKNLVGPIILEFQKRKEPVLIEEDTHKIEQDDKELEADKIRKSKLAKKKKRRNEVKNFIRTVKSTYFENNYNAAITQLKPFTKSSNIKLKARALFYIGLSYYNLNQFEKAIDYFVKPIVLKNQKRARFWYKRTLEKIK